VLYFCNSLSDDERDCFQLQQRIHTSEMDAKNVFVYSTGSRGVKRPIRISEISFLLPVHGVLETPPPSLSLISYRKISAALPVAEKALSERGECKIIGVAHAKNTVLQAEWI
jgi:hypothetical protein